MLPNFLRTLIPESFYPQKYLLYCMKISRHEKFAVILISWFFWAKLHLAAF